MLILIDKKTDGTRTVEIFSVANKNKLQLVQLCNPVVPLT